MNYIPQMFAPEVKLIYICINVRSVSDILHYATIFQEKVSL